MINRLEQQMSIAWVYFILQMPSNVSNFKAHYIQKRYSYQVNVNMIGLHGSTMLSLFYEAYVIFLENARKIEMKWKRNRLQFLFF